MYGSVVWGWKGWQKGIEAVTVFGGVMVEVRSGRKGIEWTAMTTTLGEWCSEVGEGAGKGRTGGLEHLLRDSRTEVK
jgi:hypothetical protein